MLENIKNPSDIKSLTDAELTVLSDEIRKSIINTVSKNGGHLASNLGMVEATIALHRVFDSPKDKLIFDVSHQCYTHKLLTGRYDSFDTLRQYNGMSGFTNRMESEHDILNEGHSGSSISAALGIATANKLLGSDDFSVAIVGDGSLTNGMIYEALNNCADRKLNLIIIINDNEMSISKNVGGLHRYLNRIRTSNGYFRFKRKFEYFLSAIPLIGNGIAKFLKLIKDSLRRLFVKDTLFEDLGLVYVGPVDGHDIKKLSRVLTEAKNKHQCCVVHMKTKKGYGYTPAENDPDVYHGVGIFDSLYGIDPDDTGESFSTSAGEIICDLAEKDERICAITAAMADGTGLVKFSEKFPSRFFDVGIAEEHAITFAGGLAVSGMKPVVALYSTFSQRVYDQLLHDFSVQGLPLTLLIDRAGLVPGDGITHQGIFDIGIFSTIPDTTIYAPATYNEMRSLISESCNLTSGITVIRYPKGKEIPDPANFKMHQSGNFTVVGDIQNADVILITYGRLSDTAYEVRKRLSSRLNVGIIRLLKIFPIDYTEIESLISHTRLIYILDESYSEGSVSEKISASVKTEGKIISKSISGFIEHGSLNDLMIHCGFEVTQIIAEIDSNLSLI